MLRALYSGISGMKVNQQKLDVIGNNIANVGTTGFKGSRTRFQDMLSQSVTEAKGSSTNQGGVNPSQIGLGVKMAGVDTIMNQGSMQPTSNTLDVAIDGDGYFMVGKGPVVTSNGTTAAAGTMIVDGTNHTVTSAGGMEVMYTRDGSFTLDDEGNLLTSDGLRVLGYSVHESTTATTLSIDPATSGKINFVDANKKVVADDANLKTLVIPDTVTNASGAQLKIRSVSIGKDGLITGVLEDGTSTAIGQIAMASFKNPEGLKKLGGNLNEATANSGVAVLRTGKNTAGTDNSKAYGDQLQGMLEMSNVDLSEQFTDMIVSTRAFEASGKIITTGDEILQTIIGLKR